MLILEPKSSARVAPVAKSKSAVVPVSKFRREVFCLSLTPFNCLPIENRTFKNSDWQGVNLNDYDVLENEFKSVESSENWGSNCRSFSTGSMLLLPSVYVDPFRLNDVDVDYLSLVGDIATRAISRILMPYEELNVLDEPTSNSSAVEIPQDRFCQKFQTTENVASAEAILLPFPPAVPHMTTHVAMVGAELAEISTRTVIYDEFRISSTDADDCDLPQRECEKEQSVNWETLIKLSILQVLRNFDMNDRLTVSELNETYPMATPVDHVSLVESVSINMTKPRRRRFLERYRCRNVIDNLLSDKSPAFYIRLPYRDSFVIDTHLRLSSSVLQLKPVSNRQIDGCCFKEAIDRISSPVEFLSRDCRWTLRHFLELTIQPKKMTIEGHNSELKDVQSCDEKGSVTPQSAFVDAVDSTSTVCIQRTDAKVARDSASAQNEERVALGRESTSNCASDRFDLNSMISSFLYLHEMQPLSANGSANPTDATLMPPPNDGALESEKMDLSPNKNQTPQFACSTLDILVSDVLLENHPAIISRLSHEFGIICHDCPLQHPISFAIDGDTCVVLLSSELLTSAQHASLKAFVKSISCIVFKWKTMWIVTVGSVEEPITDLSCQLALMKSLSRFPVLTVLRFLPSFSQLPALLAVICEFSKRDACTRLSCSTTSYSSRSLFSKLQDKKFSQHCSFLQQFPTVNIVQAIYILAELALVELARVPIDVAMERLNNIVPPIERTSLLLLQESLKAHIGLRAVGQLPRLVDLNHEAELARDLSNSTCSNGISPTQLPNLGSPKKWQVLHCLTPERTQFCAGSRSRRFEESFSISRKGENCNRSPPNGWESFGFSDSPAKSRRVDCDEPSMSVIETTKCSIKKEASADSYFVKPAFGRVNHNNRLICRHPYTQRSGGQTVLDWG